MPPDQIRGNGCETCDIDGLLPPRVAKRAEAIGVQKTRLDTVSLLALAVLAGSFIGFGAMLSTIVLAGAEGSLSYGGARLAAGMAFSLGLILVVVGGAELFTGNNLMVMAWAGGKVKTREVLRDWALVYAGNFVGAAATALLVFLAGQYAHATARLASRRLQRRSARRHFRSSQVRSTESWRTFSSALPCGYATAPAPPRIGCWQSFRR